MRKITILLLALVFNGVALAPLHADGGYANGKPGNDKGHKGHPPDLDC